jgi:hypothetical protein
MLVHPNADKPLRTNFQPIEGVKLPCYSEIERIYR